MGAREKAFVTFFGKKVCIDRDRDRDGTGRAIDVCIFAPVDAIWSRFRDFFTLVTSGMSDAPNRLLPQASFKRAEFILYVKDVRDVHVQLLRSLAKLPGQLEAVRYDFGMTINNGDPPTPIFEGSRLDGCMFLEPAVREDFWIKQKLVIDGEPAALLRVVPITNAERLFARKNGSEALVKLLEKNGHNFILDEKRRSCVEGPGDMWKRS